MFNLAGFDAPFSPVPTKNNQSRPPARKTSGRLPIARMRNKIIVLAKSAFPRPVHKLARAFRMVRYQMKRAASRYPFIPKQ